MTRRLIAAAGVVLAPVVLAAQPTAEASPSPWSAFLGCWQPDERGDTGLLTCFVPDAADAQRVELWTVYAGAVQRRTPLALDRALPAVDVPGCTGQERVTPSAVASRLYTAGELSCADAPTQRTVGLLAIAWNGDLVQVSGVRAGSATRVRTVRFVALPEHLLPPVVASVAGAQRRAMRLRAAVPAVDVAAIADVARGTDAAVTEAWMLESVPVGGGWTLRARDLRFLAESGTPERVMDLAVALANPDRFVIAGGDASAGVLPVTATRVAPAPVAASQVAPMTIGSMCMNPYQTGLWPVSPFITPSLWQMYMLGVPDWAIGCNTFGSRLFGLGTFNTFFGVPIGGYRPGPVVTPAPQPRPRGTVEQGRGYRAPSGTASGGSATPRTPTSTRAPASSGGSSVRSGGSSGGSAPRTAKPRNP